MTLDKIIEEWNEGTNEYNCWDELSEDEKVEFAYRLGHTNGYEESKRDGEL